MIKSNELRIGNYLYIPGLDRIVKVRSVFKTHFTCEDKDGVCFEESFRMNYQPIQLTEQWLLGFGFEFMTSRQGQTYYHIDGWTVLYTYGSWYYSTSASITIGLKLQFVHQLQNRYLSLVGEELTLKKGTIYQFTLVKNE